MGSLTAEQEARGILRRLGVRERFTSGDLVELTNVVSKARDFEILAKRQTLDRVRIKWTNQDYDWEWFYLIFEDPKGNLILKGANDPYGAKHAGDIFEAKKSEIKKMWRNQ